MGLSWNHQIKKNTEYISWKESFFGLLATLSRPLTLWHKQVDPSGCYDDLVTVRSFVPHYHLAGGVNLPKIIDCMGSDGAKRRQLVKVGGVSTRVDVPLCPPPPAVIEATPRFFSTASGTFTNSWSCFLFGHKGKVWRGKHLFVAAAFFRRRRKLVFAETLVRQLEVNHSSLRLFVLR